MCYHCDPYPHTEPKATKTEKLEQVSARLFNERLKAMSVGPCFEFFKRQKAAHPNMGANPAYRLLGA